MRLSSLYSCRIVACRVSLSKREKKLERKLERWNDVSNLVTHGTKNDLCGAFF